MECVIKSPASFHPYSSPYLIPFRVALEETSVPPGNEEIH